MGPQISQPRGLQPSRPSAPEPPIGLQPFLEIRKGMTEFMAKVLARESIPESFGKEIGLQTQGMQAIRKIRTLQLGELAKDLIPESIAEEVVKMRCTMPSVRLWRVTGAFWCTSGGRNCTTSTSDS